MGLLKKLGKWLLILLGVIIGAILILLVIIKFNSSGVEEPFLDENGEVLPNSIAMHEDMLIRGVSQRITIRGKDVNNPVLLIVHGGPGAPIFPVIYKLSGIDLEDLFTVCYWEQRGSGLAYNDSVPDASITLNEIVDDGLEVSNYLKKTFKKDKIYIEGLSWGTAVAAFMVQKKPELYHAYIGSGICAKQAESEILSYDFVMAEAQKRNDTVSINQLKKIGRPPYTNKPGMEISDAIEIERTIVFKYAPIKMDTGFNLIKGMFMDNGLTFKEKFTDMINKPESYYPAAKLMESTALNVNLFRDVPELKVPVYFMHGDNDHFTETEIAKAYFDALVAPSKKWFLFENGTHGVQIEYPEKYRAIYVNEILKK
ncbi:alpha/beta hydrolase [Algibacter amylolyticus]|uniref:Alpha/beta hydrolase n=1 Tax=Algibacter amylolyticus TaxID=1608400 RepID=A0A5M7BG85_9FLAO|nr:alpha/beta hydrolase [Algibacter amylolyticus]KAA5827528.1 alpha/beta hydrolase [Algibacter amylolyticus]MBB5266730.1 pimeloyl-ACP methyl ester carboxylesterase [Algibacter amylolyticus]TSJ81773.1 alpha/beta hydrolase [Algibacter amylolyticus]